MQVSGVKNTNIYSSMFYLSWSHRQCHVVWEFCGVCWLLGLLCLEINMHCVIKKEPSSCCSDLYSLLHWFMHLLFVKSWQPWKPKLSIYPQSEIPLSVEGMPEALIVNDSVAHTHKKILSLFSSQNNFAMWRRTPEMEADLENMSDKDNGASAWERRQAQEKVRKSKGCCQRGDWSTWLIPTILTQPKVMVSLLLLFQGHKERGRMRFCNSKKTLFSPCKLI